MRYLRSMVRASVLCATLALLCPHIQAGVCYDLSFDGGDRVTIPNSTSLNPQQITIETRVNFGRIAFGNGYSGTDCQYLMCKGGESYDGMYGLYSGWGDPATQTTTRLGFSIEDWGGNGHLQKYITPETDRWYHVAGTYDGNVMRLYLDGALIGTRTVGPYVVGNSQPLYLGYMDNSFFPYYLTGLMDEVRIWNYARTSAQIGETMDVALTGNESGLVGLWNFDESLGSQSVLDSTSNGNDGYLGNSISVNGYDPTRVPGTCLSPPVPEPTTLALCGMLGSMWLARARRRKQTR